MLTFKLEYDTVRITCNNFSDDPAEFKAAAVYLTHQGYQVGRAKLISNDIMTILFVPV